MANGDNMTWKQIGAILSIVALTITCGGVISTKADKTDLKDCEKHMAERVDLIQKELKEDVREVKEDVRRMNDKQDKMYDLLLDIKRNGSGSD